MFILKIKDKRTGTIYVYETESFWDKGKKQTRSRRKLIGKVDPETGDIVPTDGRCKHRSNEAKAQAAAQAEQKRKDEAAAQSAKELEFARGISRSFCGATMLLDAIAEKVGLKQDLRACFPEDYKQILSIAYFLMMEEGNALSRFSSWAALHHHPAGGDIPSQRSSELFQRITEDAKMRFFSLRVKRGRKGEYWALDSTSISSYSQQLNQVRYGHNKDHEPLPQLNLLVAFGEESNLPVYYRKLAGDIPDVKTVQPYVDELETLGVKGVKLLMDRGFYSGENLDTLFTSHYKFLTACTTSLKFIKDGIARHRNDMLYCDSYDDNHGIYFHTEKTDWTHIRRKVRTQEPGISFKRIYMHLYFDDYRAVDDRRAFVRRMRELSTELMEGNPVEAHEPQYKKYFQVTATRKGVRVEPKKEAMDEAVSRFGFFAMLSNDVKDPLRALGLYRNRDIVEKAFANLKERLNFNRMLVSSEAALEGKMFVHFVALILLSHIKKMMQEKELFKKYTIGSLLSKLDTIELLHIPGHRPIIREVLSEQAKLYELMGVEPPNMRA